MKRMSSSTEQITTNGNSKSWWKEREIKFLREHFEDKTYSWIADKLGRSFPSVFHKARRLGLTGKTKIPEKGITKWTPELVKKLKKLYPNERNEIIAKKLNVSKGSVRSKAHALGLKKSSDFRSRMSSKANKGKGIWTKEKDEELKRLYPKQNTRKLAEKFDTSPSTVRRRAWELGVKKKRKTSEPRTIDYLKKKGERGENMVEEFLKNNGWKVVHKGNTRTPYDFIIKKDKEKRAIQVKYGHGMTLKENSLSKLAKMNLPVYLVYIGEESGNMFRFSLENCMEKRKWGKELMNT